MNPVLTTQGVMRDLALVKQGSYSDVAGDVLDHVLFDYSRFAATTLRANTTFFSVPIGGTFGAGTKGKAETNLTDPGKLPSGQGMLVKEIAIKAKTFFGSTDVDTAIILNALFNVIHSSTFELRIAGREFDLQVPGTIFTPSLAVVGRGTVVDATDEITNYGQTLSSGWVKLATPIAIGELVSFNVTQIAGSGDATTQAILDTASNTLATQLAELGILLKGTLVRSK